MKFLKRLFHRYGENLEYIEGLRFLETGTTSRATVQIDEYAWQEKPALYIFYINFDIKPQRNDMLEIEYKGRLIRATIYSVEHRLKINLDNYNNEKPKFYIHAERLQEYDIE